MRILQITGTVIICGLVLFALKSLNKFFSTKDTIVQEQNHLHQSECQENIADICVIGLGPIGLATMFAGGQDGLSCIGIESNTFVGGQSIALYPEKIMRNVLCCDGMKAKDMIANLAQQARQFESNQILLGKTVVSYHKIQSGWRVVLNDETEIKATNLVFTIGNGIIRPKTLRKSYENVHYTSNTSELKVENKNIVVLGGGNSAIDAALQFAEKNTVHLIHRNNNFKAHPDTLERLKHHKRIYVYKQQDIESLFECSNNTVIQITMDSSAAQLDSKKCADLKDQELRKNSEGLDKKHDFPTTGHQEEHRAITIKPDYIFCYYGLACDQNSSIVEVTGVQQEKPFAKLDDNVYAVGDVVKCRDFPELFGSTFILIRAIKQNQK